MTFITLVIAFFAAHWLDIIIGAVIITALIILWRNGHKQFVQRVIKALVAKMEQQYGSKTGIIKFEAVWAELYAHVPWIIRIFFTKAELAGYIEDAVIWLTKLLNKKTGINLLTYAEELLNSHEEDTIEDKTDE